MKVGFIGTGVMGTGMIKNLLKAGNEVLVYNRTKAHASQAIDAGAVWVESVPELTLQVDAVITIVGFPRDVEELYLGEGKIVANAKPGQLLIDMTTSSPKLAQKIASVATVRNALPIDAPVSGGDVGAKNGTLTIMVGGSDEAVAKAKSLFDAMGSAITHFGNAGAGQSAKMANQIMVAGTMTGMVESLEYAKHAGIDLDKIIATINGGAAENWSMANYAPQILKEDFEPGFMIEHFVKDLRIALESADEMGLKLPGTEVARNLYQKMIDEGNGKLGTQALIKLFE
ncbi:NAD(P)-dependent oxidoreductase [Lentilactobacillus sp. Marseille-Q4993]|uniref:NAD(P)-dependent oxidoreductase n=1 Tax=Lentilactobacillus sp. Marseille-Q4993 TaxID=3039492 RepID=UPI0024BC63A8|nr:NAD(P)-dependent oxidoreductase [Lentilactobacillus sp. Marseille-Q4993]